MNRSSDCNPTCSQKGGRIIGVLVAALISLHQAYAAAPSAEKIAEVEAYLERIMDLGEIPGLAVSVYHNGKPLIERGYGYANLEWQVPLPADGVFQIASVSKPFTAMAVAQLIDAGKLSLDDTLGQHVAHVPESVADITISRMLSHTSGLGSFNFDNDYKKYSTRLDLSPDDFLPLIIDKSEPLFEPGEEVYYSNTAVWYLAYIVAKISGRTFGEYLEENIFKPFGMPSSGLNDYAKLMPKRVSGYLVSPEARKNAIGTDAPAIPYGAGALVSTVGDLQRYMYELHSGDKVSKKVKELMYGESYLNDGRSTLYSTGLLIHGDYHGHPRYEHAGTIDGFTAQTAYFTEKKLGIAVLSNANATNNGVTLIEATIANILLGIELPEPRPLPENAVSIYSGKYRFSERSEYFGGFEIGEKEGKLMLSLGGRMMEETGVEPIDLFSAGGDALIARLWGGVITYIMEFELGGGRGTFWSNGLEYKFERVDI